MKRITPTILQIDAAECGAACLGIVLSYYGRHVPSSQLRYECGVSRDGSRASQLVLAARKYGLDAEGYSQSVESLRKTPTPAILHWEFNHFVVLESTHRRGVWINDPALGRRFEPWREIKKAFTGVALTLKPNERFRKGGRRRRLSDLIWRWIGTQKRFLFLSGILGTLAVFPKVLFAFLTATLLDQVILGTQQGWGRPLGWMLAISVLFSAVVLAMRLTFVRRLKWTLTQRITKGLVGRLLQRDPFYFQQRFPAEIATRTLLSESSAGLLAHDIIARLGSLPGMMVVAVLMAVIDWRLATIAMLASTLGCLCLWTLYRGRSEFSQRLAITMGKWSTSSLSGISSVETLRASAMQADYLAMWNGHHSRVAIAMNRLFRSDTWAGMVSDAVTSVTMFAVVAWGAWRIVQGEMSFGSLVAFQMLLGVFVGLLADCLDSAMSLNQLHADLIRIEDGWPEDEHSTKSREPSGQSPPAGSSLVQLQGVSFAYSPVDAPIIRDFSLSIQPGQWVALIGATGAGKSTVARLAAGLIPPSGGQVVYGGSEKNVPSGLGYVDQSISLFAGTIRENLTLWDEQVTQSGIVRACHDADFLERVELMEHGFNQTVSAGGRTLSGGERQRLEIARALICNPKLLILDEGTSALDLMTERTVLSRLRRHTEMACLMVAHRLSTIASCDWIVWMEAGTIRCQGTHDHLWESEPDYRRMYQAEAVT